MNSIYFAAKYRFESIVKSSVGIKSKKEYSKFCCIPACRKSPAKAGLFDCKMVK
jgi:hypothetical protein